MGMMEIIRRAELPVVTATATWWNRVRHLLDAHSAYRGSSYRAEESGQIRTLS
jgi:hypothetical protein